MSKYARSNTALACKASDVDG
jgi:hypothetical protein